MILILAIRPPPGYILRGQDRLENAAVVDLRDAEMEVEEVRELVAAHARGDLEDARVLGRAARGGGLRVRRLRLGRVRRAVALEVAAGGRVAATD